MEFISLNVLAHDLYNDAFKDMLGRIVCGNEYRWLLGRDLEEEIMKYLTVLSQAHTAMAAWFPRSRVA
jgi:hypothetical protein